MSNLNSKNCIIDILEDKLVNNGLLDILLLDRTRESLTPEQKREYKAKKVIDVESPNIVWATDSYVTETNKEEHRFDIRKSITIDKIKRLKGKIKPRWVRAVEEQSQRTKDKAEVYTPSWICNMQANSIDNQRFLEKGLYTQEEINKDGIFNKEYTEEIIKKVSDSKEVRTTKYLNGKAIEEKTEIFNNTDEKDSKSVRHYWNTNRNKIRFNESYTWQDYIRENIIEITCGEAPYLVSRYDTVNGNWIYIKDRAGLLDRKFRVINENINDKVEWITWAKNAYKHTYGYEYQGDSLLIARENLLYTFIDYYKDKFNNEEPDLGDLKDIAEIISWNIWQMDGLKGTLPNTCPTEITYRKPIKQEIDDRIAEGMDAREAKNKLVDVPNCGGCREKPLEGIRKTVNDIFHAVERIAIQSKKQKHDDKGRLGHNGIPCKIRDWDRYEKEAGYKYEYFVEGVFSKEESEKEVIKNKINNKNKKQGLF